MSDEKNKRVIIVIGMHRSGTSAITKGLEALGVNLGKTLLPPVASDNDKGYFEDSEIHQLNIDLLNELGRNWQDLSLISAESFEQAKIIEYKQRAITLIKQRLSDSPFGLKDPRIIQLLPFWKTIFEELSLEPSYVIAVRHPISVARSLASGKRGEIEDEKSFYLWLEYTLPTLLATLGSNRVVVDYDLLMKEPEVQLERVANTLKLPLLENIDNVRCYSNEFLDGKLRHTQFSIDDLRSDIAVPNDVVFAYETLLKMASDELSMDSQDAYNLFLEIDSRLNDFAPAFNYIDRLEKKLSESRRRANSQLSEAQSENERLNSQLSEVQGEKERLESCIEAVYSSTSWKISLPVRKVSRYIKKIKSLL